jgi:hypothetical protein
MMALGGRRGMARVGIATDGIHFVAVRTQPAVSATLESLDILEVRADQCASVEETPHRKSAARVVEALGGIAKSFGLPVAALDVALLPPLGSFRQLDLPRLNKDELRRILARDAGRYFPGVFEAQVVGVEPVSGFSRFSPASGPCPFYVASAPGTVVEGIFDAAATIGWKVRSVVLAHCAWAAAGMALWPQLAREGLVVVLGDEATLVLGLGRLGGIVPRRLPAACDSSVLAEALLPEPGAQTAPAVGLLGTAARKAAIGDDLQQRGVIVTPLESEDLGERPDVLAAMYAGHAEGPKLVPEIVRNRFRTRVTRQTRWVAAAGVTLLLLVPLLDLWGIQREVAVVERERAAVREEVQEAIVQGEALVSTVDRAVTLGELERSAPRWSLILAEVTEHLPSDAYLESFGGRADTLFLRGVAGRAGGVFEQLEEAPSIDHVTAEGPIERLETSIGSPRETFVLSAGLQQPPELGPES